MRRPYEQRFSWKLDWNLLRTFMVVVEQRSVSKAADFLGLKQPTISGALKRLEETTGHQLIERKPNRFHVTKAGKALYNECVTIFTSVSQLPALISAGEEELAGHVALICASHVISPHLDRVLDEFAQRYPRVTYSMVVAESGEVVSRIRENQASLGICLLNDQPKNLDCRVLFREYFGLYCGPRHRLFGKTDIAPSELKGESSVSFQTETERGPLDSVARLRVRAGLSPGPRGVSSNLNEVRRMIGANIGIGALPVHIARQDVENGKLWQLPPYSRLPKVEIFLVTNPRRNPSAPEAALIEALHAMIDETPMAERTYS
ncbi:LysR family transcriptional regulator [Cucumibacter marinus]|uniref:LysR family transcriptional regulator n=1 Tax=Cucumibacter marinus TaxID=1121252 RepID=UPI0004044C13|nr:LysR family transcriptional regulator [Cucumibacter marinus]